MEVSPDTFKEMIERMSRSGSGQDERRSAPRVQINAKVAIISDFAALERPVDITVRDLSLKGVGFEHPLPIRKGSTFVLLLPGPNDQALSILCLVRQVRPLETGGHFVGAEFRQVLGIPVVKPVAEAA